MKRGTASILTCVLFLQVANATQAPLAGEPASFVFRGEGTVETFEPGAVLFTDRPFELAECPEWLKGKPFLKSGIDTPQNWTVSEPGILTVLAVIEPKQSSQMETLEKAGFIHIDEPGQFRLFGKDIGRIYQKQVQKGERFRFGKYVIATGFAKAGRQEEKPWSENSGERLYNGIVLPEEWPPQNIDISDRSPMPVPYLDHPPAVIPIDVGRQLFVDDFLIEKTEMKRTFHQAEKYAGNPVFKAESEEEKQGLNCVYLGHGGLGYDREAGLFKMVYTAGWRGPLSMATSHDMVHWEKPDFGDGRGNVLLPVGAEWKGPSTGTAGSDNSFWFDFDAANPSERFKFLTCWMHVPRERRPKGFNHSLQTSADGLNWSPAIPANTRAGDYCSFFYNPFRGVWVQSIKKGVRENDRGRSRFYTESPEFMKGGDWSDAAFWTAADSRDLPEPEGRYPGAGEPPELYSLNAVAYESLMVGMHYLHRGPHNDICKKGKFPKLTDLELGFSRDGFHWDRPSREGFIAGTRRDGDWDRAYLHGTTGVFVILNDRLIFPYTGFSGIAADGSRDMYAGASVGIATLRRDGFASMDAGQKTGTLTTRLVTFSGRHLFVNVDAPEGTLRAEVLDMDGNPVEPFTMAKSIPVSTDSTLEALSWDGGADLSALVGQPVRFRFELTNGSLYAFWVSKDETGRSDGYLGMGGPGYTGATDTVGRKALK